MADGIPTWEEIARDHGRFLYNVAYRLAGNDDDAQDLVQEALIRVRKGLERYEPGSLNGWLARIVTNVFLDEVRRRKRRPTDALPDDPSYVLPAAPAADDVYTGMSDEIQRALGRSARRVPRAGRAVRRQRPLLRADRGGHRRADRHGAVAAAPRSPHAARRAHDQRSDGMTGR